MAIQFTTTIMKSFATIAAIAGLAAAGSAASPSDSISNCPYDVLSLSTEDVQTLLKEWNLDHALGAEFSSQHVDGFMLAHISTDTVDRTAYPNAQPFHWTALFTRLELCKIGKQTKADLKRAAKGLSSEGESAPANGAEPARRRLGSGMTASHSGIHIVSNKSTIAFGPDADIMMYRSEENVMSMDNHVAFCNGNGLLFCNAEGDDITVTSDDQGNLYVGGNVHFTGNVSHLSLPLH